ncbi:hypothetical protein Bca101_043276 [Brassica carinata]
MYQGVCRRQVIKSHLKLLVLDSIIIDLFRMRLRQRLLIQQQQKKQMTTMESMSLLLQAAARELRTAIEEENDGGNRNRISIQWPFSSLFSSSSQDSNPSRGTD